MAFAMKILADSIAPCGKRLTTMEWTYPRPIHAEIMTHKMLSKNSASSRAIPPEKLIAKLLDDPWVPDYIGANQKGMAPGEELKDSDREKAVSIWLHSRDNAIWCAREMIRLNVHKGVINRLLEPWMWITVIISGTEWPNLFGLRLDKAAEPHFQHIARMAKRGMDESTPRVLKAGEWHLPLVNDEEDNVLIRAYMEGRAKELQLQERTYFDMFAEIKRKISVGRCARVSYLTHDGRRDIAEDIALHDRLIAQRPLHASPAEHQGAAMDWPAWWSEAAERFPRLEASRLAGLDDMRGLLVELKSSAISRHERAQEIGVLSHLVTEMQSGNFFGFTQYRKTMPYENITSWADVPALSAVSA